MLQAKPQAAKTAVVNPTVTPIKFPLEPNEERAAFISPGAVAEADEAEEDDVVDVDEAEEAEADVDVAGPTAIEKVLDVA